MQTIREFNRKIQSLKNTGKITNSMKMISSVKLQRFVKSRTAALPFWQAAENLLAQVYKVELVRRTLLFGGYKNPKSALIVLVTSDRGMCGQYNNNAIRQAVHLQDTLNERGLRVTLSFTGSRGANFFKKRDVVIGKLYEGLSSHPEYAGLTPLGDACLEQYLSGEFHEIWLVYTRRESSLQETPVAEQLFPLHPPRVRGEKEKLGGEMLFEPSAERLMEKAARLLVRTRIQQMMVESAVSEHSARMSAMDSASSNAERMIDHYLQLRNRARQSAITTELNEIVTGKEALAG